MLVPLLNPLKKRHRRSKRKSSPMSRLRKAKARVAALRKDRCKGWVFKKGATKRFSHLQSRLTKARKSLDKAMSASMLQSHRKAERVAARRSRSAARRTRKHQEKLGMGWAKILGFKPKKSEVVGSMPEGWHYGHQGDNPFRGRSFNSVDALGSVIAGFKPSTLGVVAPLVIGMVGDEVAASLLHKFTASYLPSALQGSKFTSLAYRLLVAGILAGGTKFVMPKQSGAVLMGGVVNALSQLIRSFNILPVMAGMGDEGEYYMGDYLTVHNAQQARPLGYLTVQNAEHARPLGGMALMGEMAVADELGS